MTKETGDTARNAATQDCVQVCPEFCIPIIEHFSFLNQEFGFEEPVFKHVSRECSVTFSREDSQIKISYEPYTLPWGYIIRSDETIPIDDLIGRYGFHLDETKYREYDEIRNKLFSLLDSPREADEYAVGAKTQFEHAVAEHLKDIASFLREHWTNILLELGNNTES